MCGFFAFASGMSAREISDAFEVTNLATTADGLESLKFYPKSLIPTISKNSPNTLVMRYWSIIPRWWKEDPYDIPFSTFNARSEEIREKATYRTPWKNNQRCLIPATWFYEFHAVKDEKKKVMKVPYRVQVPNEKVFTIAGLYEIWKNKNDEEVQSVTILTIQSIKPLAEIHDRQPVIIEEKDREKWLLKETDQEEAYELLKPTKSLECFQINHVFNKTFGHNVTLDLVSPIK